MNKKLVLLALVSVFTFSAVFTARFIPLVTANPVPYPTIRMPYEYIDATISLDEGVMKAKVNGTYTFENHGYYFVTMYYPVPPDSEGISVKLGNTLLDWNYSNWNYSTVIGDFPMIWWSIEDTPEHFNVTTYYEHPVPLIDGNYMFLYAMGTGRFLADWPTLTTAYVTIRIGMDIASPETLNLYTIEDSSGTWIWKPANYTITPETGTWKIISTFQSEFLEPLKEDVLLTFTPTTIPTHHDEVKVGDQTFDIYTITSSTMSDFNFSLPLKQISFNVTGPEGTTGFCNVAIPKTLLEILWDNNYTVLIDGSPPLTLSETSNGTHTFLYFTYPHTAHQVTIVPEFPLALIVPMLMIVTLVTTIIFGKTIPSNRHKGKEHT